MARSGFKATEFGDDKDRVLMRADGTPTYIAGDAAYHKDKFDRGFDRAINVWGADHAGYVARTKASVAALGYDPARLDVLLYQLVNIVKDGEVVQSSKRKGNILELKADLIDEIGKDAARFFFLMRSPHSALEIDINLAKKTEKDNPVYYVQYAHARIVQAIEKAREEKGVAVPAASEADLSLLTRGDRDRPHQETERTARRDRPGRLGVRPAAPRPVRPRPRRCLPYLLRRRQPQPRPARGLRRPGNAQSASWCWSMPLRSSSETS